MPAATTVTLAPHPPTTYRRASPPPPSPPKCPKSPMPRRPRGSSPNAHAIPRPPARPTVSALRDATVQVAGEAETAAFMAHHGSRATKFLVMASAEYQLALSQKVNKRINVAKVRSVLDYVDERHAVDPNVAAASVRHTLSLFGPTVAQRRASDEHRRRVVQFLRRTRKLFVPAGADPFREDTDSEYSDVEEDEFLPAPNPPMLNLP